MRWIGLEKSEAVQAFAIVPDLAGIEGVRIAHDFNYE
jgi:hypothetical protein